MNYFKFYDNLLKEGMKEELKDGKQRYANTRDFLMVISETKPSIRKEDIERYKNWNEVYGVS